jgi:hypothetical protein
MASDRMSEVFLQKLNASPCAAFSGRSRVSGLHQLHGPCAPGQKASACHAEFPELDGRRDVTTSHPIRQQAGLLLLALTFFSSAILFWFHLVLSLHFFNFLPSFFSLFRLLLYSCFNYFFHCSFLLVYSCTPLNKLQIWQWKLTIIVLSGTIYSTPLQLREFSI